ncbi:MAG: hypothetical protein L0Y42_03765 [Phycisphaerales bacterium]|nr:hypothetical protein [Phycisphaerales bacterium]
MATETQRQDLVRAVVRSAGEHRVVLELPGTAYQLHLKPVGNAESFSAHVGKRITGTMHAQALRMFLAKGGGRFIEPIQGEPRIVAGRVIAVDQANRRVLVDVAAPVWMTLEERQAADAFDIGDLVNCYVQSGVTFRPT